MTLQDLIDFANKHKIKPNECTILLRQVCANSDVELDYFDKCYCENGVKVLNKNDEFEKVEKGISLRQLWIPDFMGN